MSTPRKGLTASVNDGAARLQMLQRCLGHVKVAVQVGSNRHVKVLDGQLFERARVLLKGGIVGDDINMAEVIHHLLHRVLAEVEISNVAAEDHTSSSLAFHGTCGFRRVLVLRQIDDGDIGALARQQDGHGPADTGVCACDQGDPILQFAAVDVGRRQEIRPRLDPRFALTLLKVSRRQRLGRLHPLTGLYRW